jgi:hypothetical protein
MTATERSTTPAASHRADATATLAQGCVNPIRLRGYYQRVSAETGEVLGLFGSPERPNGVLLVACKDRRANCCATCARLYERDAYHLIAAGLRGGKSIPTSVGSHPAVMLTLTAPSFGAVHGHRDNVEPCRCGARHQIDDPQLGMPIEPRSYRYADQVIWNHYAPELWKRTVQAVRRGLAQALGIPRSKLSQIAHVRFAKVGEFQRRGVVHYHAVIRIDGPDGPNTSPPASCVTSLLAEIVNAAAASCAIQLPAALVTEVAPSSDGMLRWGEQRDVEALDRETCTKAAGYIAKYATKATEAATGGTLVAPIRSLHRVDELDLAEHAKSLIRTAWLIGERTRIQGFKRWAHQFGYGGHTLTKSRDYSLTFAALRAARIEWRRATNGEQDVVVRAKLTYAGRGHELVQPRGAYANPSDSSLASDEGLE